MGKELVFVTGGSGYIGSWVCREFLDAGYKVKASVRSVNSEKVEFLKKWIMKGDDLELVEADLLKPEGWSFAGCDYVVHVASPFYMGCVPEEAEEKFYKPARDGTLNILKAALSAGIKRVVLTSSVAAIQIGHTAEEMAKDPEEYWSVIENAGGEPYTTSKTIAEKAAWDFCQENQDSEGMFDFVTINPSLVVGPPLSSNDATSHETVRTLLLRKIPGAPNMPFSVIDVRDVAVAHRLAIEVAEAKGNRFVCSGDEAISLVDWGILYNAEFTKYGFNPPTRKIPYFILWGASFFDSMTAMLLPLVDSKPINFDNSKIKRILGLNLRDRDTSLIEHAHGCLRMGTEGFTRTPEYEAYLAQSS